MIEDWEGRGMVFEDCVEDFWAYGVGAGTGVLVIPVT